MDAAPAGSVRWVPLGGQRSCVVRYWTVDHTSTLAAGWPSRSRRTNTVWGELVRGLALATVTVEPSKWAASSAAGSWSVLTGAAGLGVAAGGAGVTVASMIRRAGGA